MHSDINYLKQQKLASNVEIAGVFQKTGEKLIEIVETIGEKFNVPIKEADIKGIFRKKNGTIVLKLKEEKTCEDLISASFKQNVTNDTIGISQSYADKAKSPTAQSSTSTTIKKQVQKIFINHQLTEYNNLIYKKLRDLKKSGKIHKIKFRNGSYAIKTTETSKYFKNIFNIKQIDELEK